MKSDTNTDRIHNIYQMLFEMATGNFAFQITIGHHNDQLEKIEAQLSTIAEQMTEAILQSGYVIPHYRYQGIVQFTFILSKKLQIECTSTDAVQYLGYPADKLWKIDFQKLLWSQSSAIWLKIVAEINSDEKYHNTLHLIFINADQKLLPTFCTVSRLFFTEKIFICSVSTILQDALADTFGPHNPAPKQDLAATVQGLHDYIVSHLEDFFRLTIRWPHIFIDKVVPKVSGLPKWTAPKSYAYNIYFLSAMFLIQKESALCLNFTPTVPFIKLYGFCRIVF